MSKGKLFVISGTSGVGKSTVLARVIAAREDLRFSVSATTRAPRPNEVEGQSYYFISKETFQSWIEQEGTGENPEARALRQRIGELFRRAQGTMN